MTRLTIRFLSCWILLTAGALQSQSVPDPNRDRDSQADAQVRFAREHSARRGWQERIEGSNQEISNFTHEPVDPPQPQARVAGSAIARRVWRERIEAPVSPRGNDPSDLQSLIERLRSAQFKPQPSETPVSVDDANALPMRPLPAEQPTVAVSTPRMEPPPLPIPILTAPAGPLSVQTLTQIESMTDQPMEAELALQLADVLYQGQHRDRATSFYRLAVDTLDPNAPLAQENRAWALFQLGNCLREKAPAEAKLAYQRLASAYPSSPWAQLATMWHDLADWYWREQPLETLEQVTLQPDQAVLAPSPVDGEAKL
jgi:tetratricopeptide (TPR) repeat protein